MQMVINISERAYWYCKGGTGVSELVKAVKNGVILPEGHGRLIDADVLTDSIMAKTFGLRVCDIEKTPTVIEADKGSEG